MPDSKVIVGKRLDTAASLPYTLSMGNHALFAGLTGFGKSNQINYILYQAAKYPDIQFAVCNAAGKSDYMQWLPRASAVAIGKNATDHVVDGILGLMNQRYADLLPEGIKHDMTPGMARDLAMTGSRKVQISDDLPLVILVIDEFVQYLSGRIGAINTYKLMTLVTIGRAAGLLVILATQRPSQKVASTDIRENIPYKISFRLDKYGAAMVFGDRADEIPLDELDAPGHGYAMLDEQTHGIQFIAPECDERAVGARAIQTESLRREFKGIDWFKNDILR